MITFIWAHRMSCEGKNLTSGFLIFTFVVFVVYEYFLELCNHLFTLCHTGS